MVRSTENQEAPKVAYVFPGQGAQSVGMGLELYRSSKAAKELFDEVDDILSLSLSEIIFEGPSSELERTVNSQPAIMATSLACLKAVEELQPEASHQAVAVAGHSLGEYTSLVVSGALDLGEGIRLVRERGRLMQEASDMLPGSMAAVLGMDEVTLEEICIETGAQIANINGGDQIVISGDKIAVARAVDLASIRGARKAIPLAVSGAFHSALMSPAREGLAAAVEAIQFRDPVIPIFANSTSQPLASASQVKEELLTQLCSCVHWKQSVSNMIDSGVSSFVEFGPGKVLGALIKRISAAPYYKDRRVEILSVGDMASAQQVAEASARSFMAMAPSPAL